MKALPKPAFVLIALATGLAWLVALLVLAAAGFAVLTGGLLPVLGGFLQVPGTPGAAIEIAVILQKALMLAAFVLILVCGTGVLQSRFGGRARGERFCARGIVRGLMVLAVLGTVPRWLFSGAGGVTGAGLAVTALSAIPILLIQLAALLCADARLGRGEESIF